MIAKKISSIALVTSLAIYMTTSMAADPNFATIPNDYAQSGSQTKTIEISVIPEERAKKLFTQFLKDDLIPFKHPTACSANATYMAKSAEEAGINTGRVVIEGVLLPYTRNNSIYPRAKWQIHTAPVVYVLDSKGKKQLMVIDPSISATLLTMEDWKAKMLGDYDGLKGRIDQTYFGSRFQYGYAEKSLARKQVDPPEPAEPSRSDWDEEDSENSERMRSTFMREIDYYESTGTKFEDAPATPGAQ